MPAGIEAIADLVLDLLQDRMRFFEDQLADFCQIGARQRALARMLFQRADHTCQSGLDIQQCPGDIHQQRIVRRTLALSQMLQYQHLFDNYPPGLAEIEHSQGVGDLAQRGKQRLQVVQAPTIAAHKQVETLLGPHQVFAQRCHHRAQGIAVGTRLQSLAQRTQRQVEIGQFLRRHWRCTVKAALAQRFYTAFGAQLVKHGQHDQWQVTSGAAQPIQIQRQLLQAAKQGAKGLSALGDALLPQSHAQLLQLFSKQCGTTEFQHHQTATHLMQIFNKADQVLFIARLGAKMLQRQTCLGQTVSNGALDPGQGHRIVPLSHICSRCHGHVRTLNLAASVAG